jgi:hypothetical protein
MHVDVCMYNYSILYYNIENYIYDINIKILYMMLFSTKKTQFVPFWVIVTRFLKWRTRQEHSFSSLIP